MIAVIDWDRESGNDGQFASDLHVLFNMTQSKKILFYSLAPPSHSVAFFILFFFNINIIIIFFFFFFFFFFFLFFLFFLFLLSFPFYFFFFFFFFFFSFSFLFFFCFFIGLLGSAFLILLMHTGECRGAKANLSRHYLRCLLRGWHQLSGLTATQTGASV